MRKIFVLLTAVSFVMVSFGFSLVHKSKASESHENSDGSMVIQGTPGSR